MRRGAGRRGEEEAGEGPPAAASRARPACLGLGCGPRGNPSSGAQARRLGLAPPARRPCASGPAQLPKRAGSSRAAQPGGDPSPQPAACSLQPPPTPHVALPPAGPLPPVRPADWIRLSGRAGSLRASAARAAGGGRRKAGRRGPAASPARRAERLCSLPGSATRLAQDRRPEEASLIFLPRCFPRGEGKRQKKGAWEIKDEESLGSGESKGHHILYRPSGHQSCLMSQGSGGHWPTLDM